MSYDIHLVDPVSKETLQLPCEHAMIGGTYAADYDPKTGRFTPKPISEAHINITYNYGKYYYEATDGDPRFAHDEVTAYYTDGSTGPTKTAYGIRGLYGKTGAESIPMIKYIIDFISKKYPSLETSDDYWEPTPGNAVRPLYQLLAMAQLRPDGVWDGD